MSGTQADASASLQSGADAVVHYISKACDDLLKAAPRRATALKDACTLTLSLSLHISPLFSLSLSLSLLVVGGREF